MYDRLKLHLARQFYWLPHMSFCDSAPTYAAKGDFVQYLDEYFARFQISLVCNTIMVSALHIEKTKTWCIKTYDAETTDLGEHLAEFLVVTTGENAQKFVPNVHGLKSFKGEVAYVGKKVLVVGCGNFGMEISYDLEFWHQDFYRDIEPSIDFSFSSTFLRQFLTLTFLKKI